MDISQVTDVFLITENYLFRRNICDLPTNALNKIFLMLHREIIRYDGTDADYVEKFKYALLSKKERARFPDDDEFVTHFTERQVYQMNSKNKIYILERLENYGTAEDKDVYSHCDDGTYSTEHIMPQHLTPAWVKALGDDYEQIHETWLHRIANLTLTAYNSKYSNSSFEEKKTMKNGFEDSGIRMNTYIAKKEKRTLAELEERNQYLMGRALEIWVTPSTEFKPEEKQLDSYTLDDDANLKELDKAIEGAESVCDESMSDYDKVVALNEYFRLNASYDTDSMATDVDIYTISESFIDVHTPYGILCNDYGVCESYSEAFILTSRMAGLESIGEFGTLFGGGHEWNRVKVDGVLVPGVGYVVDSVPFAAPSGDKEYYYMNGLAVEDYTDAAAFIVKQLEKNSKVSIRVPSTTSEDEVKLVFRELAQEGVKLQKGYYRYGVIHVE